MLCTRYILRLRIVSKGQRHIHTTLPPTDTQTTRQLEAQQNTTTHVVESSSSSCVVCLTEKRSHVFLPCAHLASCLECSLQLNKCPICRTDVKAKVKIFITT